MPRKAWWSTTLADQSTLMQNFVNKIAGYAAVLGLTPAEITEMQNLGIGFISAYNFAEGCRLSMQAATQWRDLVFYGEPTGMEAPPPPVFPVTGSTERTRGTVTQFFAVRDRIVASAGYTTAIGEDLGLVGAEIAPRPESDLTPELKLTVSFGNTVNLVGSMQGMDALRVEYAPKGGNFTTVAFLTKTPGGFQVTPTIPNQPETGVVRAVFIRKNAEVGNFSPSYPVTVS